MVRFNRVLLKISGEALQRPAKSDETKELGYHWPSVMKVAQKIKAVHSLGIQVVVVIGGGNLLRGEEMSEYIANRVKADYAGMLATVMNGLILSDALEQCGVPVRVQSALNMVQVAESYLTFKALRHLEKGRVVILTAGMGVPYVTTDSGAALHALELECQVLLKATKVDGVFERDPHQDSTARRFKTLKYADAINLGEIQVIDKSALVMCQKNNLPALVVNVFNETALLAAVQGAEVGTYLDNKVQRVFAETNIFDQSKSISHHSLSFNWDLAEQ